MPREKIIKTPEELWNLFTVYKEWVKKNPFLVHDFVGKDAEEVRKERERPITWSGFEGWLAQENILTQLTMYEQNDRNSYTEYLPIITRIKRQCRANVIDGALSGVYNANLAARIEGLKEHTDVTTNGKDMSPVITAMVDGKIVDGELK